MRGLCFSLNMSGAGMQRPLELDESSAPLGLQRDGCPAHAKSPGPVGACPTCVVLSAHPVLWVTHQPACAPGLVAAVCRATSAGAAVGPLPRDAPHFLASARAESCLQLVTLSSCRRQWSFREGPGSGGLDCPLPCLLNHEAKPCRCPLSETFGNPEAQATPTDTQLPQPMAHRADCVARLAPSAMALE